jgi:imidazoleglycerol-phosphate dehydratase
MAVKVERRSAETEVSVELGLDGGPVEVRTGVGFLDHMLSTLAYHAGWTLRLACRGDLEVDEHHSVEDCGICLGLALKDCVGALKSPARFGYAYAPLDEALARAVVDLSGRAFCATELGLRGERLGGLSAENLGHFLATFAANAGLTLHVDLLRGENDHHRAEAAFKALALALRSALAERSGGDGRYSTKGRPVISVQDSGGAKAPKPARGDGPGKRGGRGRG